MIARTLLVTQLPNKPSLALAPISNTLPMITRTLLVTQLPDEPSITLTSIHCTLPMIARTLLITQLSDEPWLALTSIHCALAMIAYSNSTTLARPFNTSSIFAAIWTRTTLLDDLQQGFYRQCLGAG
eukprot:SAG11_NODE_4219_length_2005_cov_12.122246_3_plen_127_part_00